MRRWTAGVALVPTLEESRLTRVISNVPQVRVAFGALKLEQQCVWAVVQDYTAPEKDNQVHCFEGGENCQTKA